MSQGGIYLLVGPDRPSKLQRIHELTRTLGVQPLDSHHVDAAECSAAELLALCRQQPATSPLRLVVVDQAHRLDHAGTEALLQQADVIAKNACLLLLLETDLSLKHPLARIIAQGEGRSERHERGAGSSVQSVVVERFAGRAGQPAKPFALIDALGNRDAAGALTALHDQLTAGKDPLELLGLVAWQLQRWVTVRRLRDAGLTAERIAELTGWRAWQVERIQREVAQRPLGSLREALARCWQFDVDAKSGRHLPQLAIEQLVIELCRTSEPVRGC